MIKIVSFEEICHLYYTIWFNLKKKKIKENYQTLKKLFY